MSFLKKLVNIRILSTRKKKLHHSMLLFFLNFTFVFVIGVVPNVTWKNELYNIVVSGIFFAAVISISDQHIRYLVSALVLTIFTWVYTYLSLNFMIHLNSILTIIFFSYIIAFSSVRISKSKKVGTLEFLRSVNIYFLIGIVGAVVFKSLYATNPDSIHIPGNKFPKTTDLVFFSFETITTLGYGDITPVSAMAKSIAIFLSFSGQLYLTFIIAMLIGKYLRGDYRIEEKNDK